MKQVSLLSIIFGLFCLVVTSIGYAQPQKGLYGISINLTNGFFTSQSVKTPAGPYTIGIIYLPSDKIRLRGDIGFRSQKNISGDKESEFAFTANLWRYFTTKDNISTFLGGDFIVGSVSSNKSTGLIGFGVGGGAEYWASKRFSIYGQLGLNYGHYSVDDDTANDIYTSAAVGVCWYF
jgi:hypothetical protein